MTWTLEIDGASVEVPDGMLLVSAQDFEDYAKCFDFVVKAIDEAEPKPEDSKVWRLILARKSAREAAASCRSSPSRNTTQITTAAGKRREQSAPAPACGDVDSHKDPS